MLQWLLDWVRQVGPPAVWGVFMSRGQGQPYDLQGVFTSEPAARDFADRIIGFRSGWKPLSTGRHWFYPFGDILRVSRIICDRPRTDEDNDPTSLASEIEALRQRHSHSDSAHGDAWDYRP